MQLWASTTYRDPAPHWAWCQHTNTARQVGAFLPQAPVVAGRRYSFSVVSRIDEVTAAGLDQHRIEVDWYSATDGYLGHTDGPWLEALAGHSILGDAAVRVAGEFTAPAGAVRGNVLVRINAVREVNSWAVRSAMYVDLDEFPLYTPPPANVGPQPPAPTPPGGWPGDDWSYTPGGVASYSDAFDNPDSDQLDGSWEVVYGDAIGARAGFDVVHNSAPSAFEVRGSGDVIIALPRGVVGGGLVEQTITLDVQANGDDRVTDLVWDLDWRIRRGVSSGTIENAATLAVVPREWATLSYTMSTDLMSPYDWTPRVRVNLGDGGAIRLTALSGGGVSSGL